MSSRRARATCGTKSLHYRKEDVHIRNNQPSRVFASVRVCEEKIVIFVRGFFFACKYECLWRNECVSAARVRAIRMRSRGIALTHIWWLTSRRRRCNRSVCACVSGNLAMSYSGRKGNSYRRAFHLRLPHSIAHRFMFLVVSRNCRTVIADAIVGEKDN